MNNQEDFFLNQNSIFKEYAVYFPIKAGVILLIADFLIFGFLNVTDPEGNMITVQQILFMFMLIIGYKDRKFLKNERAYSPRFIWIFLPTVYIYKRQKNNNLGLKYFWINSILFLSIWCISYINEIFEYFQSL